MTTAAAIAIVIISAALVVAGWFIFDLSCRLAFVASKLSDSDRIRHEVAESAMRGAPAVWFARPAGMDNPAADAGYWRVMIAGAPHDFTTEQVAVAAKRGAHFASHKPATTQ